MGMARRIIEENVPGYEQLIIPTLRAMVALGGSGTIQEINEVASDIAGIDEDALQVPAKNSVQTEVEYRLAWSRTYLRKFGLIENSARGVWSLVDADIDIDELDYREIVDSVRTVMKENASKRKASAADDNSSKDDSDEESDEFPDWKDGLIEILLSIPPDAFERLSQRLLRESGFTQVEVTGKVGDGGIDGKGIVRINGFLSFHEIFQCKRYKGSVSPSQIRDFRGAMQGRADKGLFITTGTFTREATKEASRDGAPPIDLIDGELLCDKLKELGLGVSTETVEVVNIKKNWFDKL
jgi:restriction system protein